MDPAVSHPFYRTYGMIQTSSDLRFDATETKLRHLNTGNAIFPMCTPVVKTIIHGSVVFQCDYRHPRSITELILISNGSIWPSCPLLRSFKAIMTCTTNSVIHLFHSFLDPLHEPRKETHPHPEI